MNSALDSSVASQDMASRPTKPEVSLFRLYTLRAAYFVMAAALGARIGTSETNLGQHLPQQPGIRQRCRHVVPDVPFFEPPSVLDGGDGYRFVLEQKIDC